MGSPTHILLPAALLAFMPLACSGQLLLHSITSFRRMISTRLFSGVGTAVFASLPIPTSSDLFVPTERLPYRLFTRTHTPHATAPYCTPAHYAAPTGCARACLVSRLPPSTHHTCLLFTRSSPHHHRTRRPRGKTGCAATASAPHRQPSPSAPISCHRLVIVYYQTTD